jgi:hypothetical protein
MRMPVTDDQVAVLPAYLADDMAEHRQLYARLDRETARIGYVAPVTAAFITAVSRRFAQESTADVIGFVADLRSRSGALAGSTVGHAHLAWFRSRDLNHVSLRSGWAEHRGWINARLISLPDGT